MDAEITKSSSTTDSPSAQPAQAQTVTVPIVDADGLAAAYANFVRVSPSPEELVLDFGLNQNVPGSGQATAVKISDRLVLNYFTAKRLWGGLGLALQRHEQTFGVLEVDVNKRVLPASQRPQR
jgi:hypothetical protein